MKIKKNLIKYILPILVTFLFLSCDNAKKASFGVVKVDPQTVKFDVTVVGSSNQKSFIIRNVTTEKDGTLTVESITLGDRNKEFYEIVTDVSKSFKLKKGEEKQIDVLYTAKETDLEKIEGVIKIAYGNATTKTSTVILDAEKANAKLSLSHESIVFDSLTANEEAIFELTVKNEGTSELIFTGKDDDGTIYSGKDAIRFGNGTSTAFELLDLDNIKNLAPYTFDDNGVEIYDSFKIRVKYKGTGDNDSGTLLIFNNSINSPNKKIINITATSKACRLLIQPADLYIDFGERPVNLEGINTILLANAGTGDCNIQSIDLLESSDSEFTLTLEDDTDLSETPKILKPSERFKAFVHFTPTEQTGSGGAAGVITIKSDDPYWEDGKQIIELFGKSKEDDSPVCLIKAADGSEPSFEVEPGQIEAVKCKKDGRTVPVCSNVQMKSASTDPRGEDLTLTWRMVASPASYSNPAWMTDITPSGQDLPRNTVMDFYVPYATPPGTKYLVELTVRNESGLESSCTTEMFGLTGNSLHIELFWENASDVDLHLSNPESQNLNIDDIDENNTGHHSLDPELISFRSESNKDWWSDGTIKRDCHYRNCKGDGIEWGAVGSNDNPRLDRDDIPGTGPENINIAKPKEAWYRVAIHYFSSSKAPRGTDAHVRVYCNGIVAYQNTAFLLKGNSTEGYWWNVGDIFWKSVGENGICYVYSDGQIYDHIQGKGQAGYQGNFVEDIEPDNE